MGDSLISSFPGTLSGVQDGRLPRFVLRKYIVRGQVDFSKRLNLLYDDVERLYHVIANFTGAICQRVLGVKFATMRVQMTSRTPAPRRVAIVSPALRAPYPMFETPLSNATNIFEAKSVSLTTNTALNRTYSERTKAMFRDARMGRTNGNHECNKRFCENCKENNKIVHLCYIRPPKDASPLGSEEVLYVFYDFETTQNTRYTDEAKLHEHNLVCELQFVSRCDYEEDLGDCVRCGRSKHSFQHDPMGEFISYEIEQSPSAKMFVAIVITPRRLTLI